MTFHLSADLERFQKDPRAWRRGSLILGRTWLSSRRRKQREAPGEHFAAMRDVSSSHPRYRQLFSINGSSDGHTRPRAL